VATQQVATVNVINVDADKFLAGTAEYYNTIIVDFPDPRSIELAKLYSKEFYLKVKNRLSETGMIVVQSASPYHAKEAFLCIMRTMQAAGLKTIPYHDNVPSFGDWGWILAWKNEGSTEDILGKINRINSFQVNTDYLTPDLFRSGLQFGKKRLESKYEGKINTLMDPLLLRLYLDEGWIIQ